jgi:sugar (glycoside-pentoside-hexuronide) transporter|tara:strand:- start:924 stop:2249 length:1326 start_codon:yes stop_codon:yes gene_type:complete
MKLSFRSKFFYGGGDFAINIMWQLTVFYLLFFYTDIFGLSPANAGLVFFIAKIWDAITDPIMGYIADNTSTRWGKFRPYILFGSVPALIMIVLCFTSPDLSQSGKFYWALFTYITFTTLYTVIAIPVGSLIPAMTQDRDERTSLASFRFLGASSGSIAVAVLTLPLVGLFSSPQYGFPIVIACLAFFGAIFAFLCFYNTKEIYSKPYEKNIGFKEIIKMIFTNFPLHFVILALLTTWVANNAKQLTTIYFVKYNLNLEAYFSPILLGVILQIMFGAYLTNLIKHRFEKKSLFMIGTFLYVITDLIVYFITGYENFWLLAFVTSFGFIGFGMAGVMAWSMIADTVEYGEWKSGFRAEGLLNAAHVFVFKLSVGVSAWLAGFVLETTNYVANAPIQNQETLEGLTIMGFIFPAIAGTTAIIVTYFNKYDSTFYEKIFTDLKQR